MGVGACKFVATMAIRRVVGVSCGYLYNALPFRVV